MEWCWRDVGVVSMRCWRGVEAMLARCWRGDGVVCGDVVVLVRGAGVVLVRGVVVAWGWYIVGVGVEVLLAVRAHIQTLTG